MKRLLHLQRRWIRARTNMVFMLLFAFLLLATAATVSTWLMPSYSLTARAHALSNGQEIPNRRSSDSINILGDAQGDCNVDGIVNASDISALTKQIFQSGSFTQECDTNEDGSISAADISCLVGFIFHSADACHTPFSQPIATPPSNPYPAPNSTPAPNPYPYPYPAPNPEPYPEPEPSNPNGVMGVQINNRLGSALASKASEANLSWVRYGGVVWSEVEAEQDQRDWEVLRAFEAHMQALVAQGLTPMVIVRGTPKWAQKVEGAFCGPIKEEALDDFADFMHQLVTRYSQPPFNIKYWELGNEPDIDPSLIHPMEPFGCWGDQDDEYYGGGYYAKMLKQVYPAIKAADAEAQVILGGLVLDCDPTAPPEGKDNQDNKDCHSSKFFEGVLRHGGGDVFDMVAYHAYPYWQKDVVDSDLTHANWQHRGGVLLGKADFIREVMARYDVDKPIIMNEGALLCHESNQSCPNDAFYQAQANYLPRLYARAWANDLQAAIWYTLNGPGWRHAGLLDEAQAPRPAYQALSFMGQLLAQATYKAQLSEGALEGYAFSDEKGDYQLYWSNDGLTHVVRLPAGTTAVYNRFGESLPFDETISVGVEPIYLELAR